MSVISIPGQSESEVKAELIDWSQEDAAWRKRERASAVELRRDLRRHASPRLGIWHRFVQTLKRSNLDDSAKLQAVNLFVNEMITYDHHKDDRFPAGKSDTEWHQTSLTTLKTGLGVCSDIARLKFATLKAAGFDPRKMRMVGGVAYGHHQEILGGHEILVADLGGVPYALNNNLIAGGAILKHGGIEPLSIFVKGVEGGSQNASRRMGSFLPVLSEDERSPARVYREAAPASGRLPAARKRHARLAMPASEGDVCVQGSCATISSPLPQKSGLRRLQGLIQEAHDLNVTRAGQEAAGREDAIRHPLGRQSLKAIPDLAPCRDLPVETPVLHLSGTPRTDFRKSSMRGMMPG